MSNQLLLAGRCSGKSFYRQTTGRITVFLPWSLRAHAIGYCCSYAACATDSHSRRAACRSTASTCWWSQQRGIKSLARLIIGMAVSVLFSCVANRANVARQMPHLTAGFVCRPVPIIESFDYGSRHLGRSSHLKYLARRATT